MSYSYKYFSFSSFYYQKYQGYEIFSSYVRDEQKKGESDIDFLVDFDKEKLGEKVDIIPKRALREELRGAILKEAISIG